MSLLYKLSNDFSDTSLQGVVEIRLGEIFMMIVVSLVTRIQNISEEKETKASCQAIIFFILKYCQLLRLFTVWQS
jgi:hypothetical protein